MSEKSKGNFSMAKVGQKDITCRRAIAEGSITLTNETFQLLESRQLAKGDALALAEIAGLQAVKRTADALPLCHPLPIDYASVQFELDQSAYSVRAICEVHCTGKTGVEMEALSGVSAALLCIYDVVKPVCREPVISNIRLNLKEGGKSGRFERTIATKPPSGKDKPLGGVKAAVVTVSDSSACGKREDLSGPVIVEFFNQKGAEIVFTAVSSDDMDSIKAAIQECIEKQAEIVITTGGTGLGPRDNTPEAISNICDRLIPGLPEQIRLAGMQFTRNSCLSRSIAGMIGRTIVLALPGSPKAVSQSLAVIQDLLGHAVGMAKGGGH